MAVQHLHLGIHPSCTKILMNDQDQCTYESVCQVSAHSTVKHVKGHLAEVTNCRCTYAYIQV